MTIIDCLNFKKTAHKIKKLIIHYLIIVYFNSVINNILDSQNSQTYLKDVKCANLHDNTRVSPGKHTLYIKTLIHCNTH